MWIDVVLYIRLYKRIGAGGPPFRGDPHAQSSPFTLSLVPMSPNGYPLLGHGAASALALAEIVQINRCPSREALICSL